MPGGAGCRDVGHRARVHRQPVVRFGSAGDPAGRHARYAGGGADIAPAGGAEPTWLRRAAHGTDSGG
jgi:hypothetical protein